MFPQRVVPLATEEELRQICGRIGDSKALGLDRIPNKALKLAVKSRLTECSEYGGGHLESNRYSNKRNAQPCKTYCGQTEHSHATKSKSKDLWQRRYDELR